MVTIWSDGCWPLVPDRGESTWHLLDVLPLDPDGVTTFPLTEKAADGLIIKVKAAHGHEDYWLLTPDDIAKGQSGD